MQLHANKKFNESNKKKQLWRHLTDTYFMRFNLCCFNFTCVNFAEYRSIAKAIIVIVIVQGCGLGREVSVSRRSQDVLSYLGLVSGLGPCIL